MAEDEHYPWMKLKRPPLPWYYGRRCSTPTEEISNLIKIDVNTLIVTTRRGHFSYNAKQNKWKECAKYETNRLYRCAPKLAFDVKSKKMFISGDESMNIYDIENEKFTQYPFVDKLRLP